MTFDISSGISGIVDTLGASSTRISCAVIAVQDAYFIYCSFSRSYSHRAKIEGQGEQDRGGYSPKGENLRVRAGVKGRYFKKDEEVVDWCGSRCLGEEEVFGEVSEWV